jgi:hypothetical protein
MSDVTIFKFGFGMPEGHARGFALLDWSRSARLDVRYGTYSVQTLRGGIEVRNLTQGQALDYLSNGNSFRLLSEEPRKFGPSWSESIEK